MKQGEKIRVGVAGSLVLDILPVLGEQTEAEDIMAEGKLTEASGVKLYLGGEVGNMGLALQHLGAAPVLISKIGDDMIGDVVRLLMEKEGADARVKRLEGAGQRSVSHWPFLEEIKVRSTAEVHPSSLWQMIYLMKSWKIWTGCISDIRQP